MAKQYTVGEYSRKFLDALDAFARFRDTFLEALTTTYGEQQANQFYNEHAERLDDVERTVMDYMRVLFTEEMGTSRERVTI